MIDKLFLPVLLAFTLVACGGGDSGSSTTGSDEKLDETIPAKALIAEERSTKATDPWPQDWHPEQLLRSPIATQGSEQSIAWDITGLPANTHLVVVNLSQWQRKAFGQTNEKGQITVEAICGDELMLRIGAFPSTQHMSGEALNQVIWDQRPEDSALDEWLRVWPTVYVKLQPDDTTRTCVSAQANTDQSHFGWSLAFDTDSDADWSLVQGNNSARLSIKNPTLRLYGNDLVIDANGENFLNFALGAGFDYQGQPVGAQNNKRVLTRTNAIGVGRTDAILHDLVQLQQFELPLPDSSDNFSHGLAWHWGSLSTSLGEDSEAWQNYDFANRELDFSGVWRAMIRPTFTLSSGSELFSGWLDAIMETGGIDGDAAALGLLSVEDTKDLSLHEPLALFYDQTADGFVTAWDHQRFKHLDFNSATHLLSHTAPVIKRTLPDGQPNPIALMPFLPRLNLADRRATAPLFYPLADDQGELTVRLEQLSDDGQSISQVIINNEDYPIEGIQYDHARDLFGQSRSTGGVHVTDVAQLILDDSNRSSLSRTFSDSGRYRISFTGALSPLMGPEVTLTQTIDFIVADELLSVITDHFPQMPLLGLESTAKELQLWPPVPATMTLDWYHVSDTNQVSTEQRQFQANKMGHWRDNTPFTTASTRGEYRLDLQGIYRDSEQRFYAISKSYAGIVTPSNDYYIRGRRFFDNFVDTGPCFPGDLACQDADDKRRGQYTWYKQNTVSDEVGYEVGDGHAFSAYHTGDVLWIQDDHAALVEGSSPELPSGYATTDDKNFDCRVGELEKELNAVGAQGNAELPATTCLEKGAITVLTQEDFARKGYRQYHYAASERYQMRVRETIGDRSAIAYWRFDDTYGDQLGMGSLGDLPNELKVQYIAGVLEPLDQSERLYSATASTFVLTGDEQTNAALNDTRVAPALDMSEPLFTLDGEKKYAVFWPTGMVPGNFYQLGESSQLQGQILPSISLNLKTTLLPPTGASQTTQDKANSLGFVQGPTQTFDQSGAWQIKLSMHTHEQTQISDGGGSASVEEFNHPLLGLDDFYYVFVVDEQAQPLPLNTQNWPSPNRAYVELDQPLDFTISPDSDAATLSDLEFFHVLFMDGWIVSQGVTTDKSIKIDINTLGDTFRTLDIDNQDIDSHGDRLRLSLFLTGKNSQGATQQFFRTVMIDGEQLSLY